MSNENKKCKYLGEGSCVNGCMAQSFIDTLRSDINNKDRDERIKEIVQKAKEAGCANKNLGKNS